MKELGHSIASNTFSGVFAVNPEDELTSDNSKVVLQDVIHGPEHLVYQSSAFDGNVGSEAQFPGKLWTASVNGTAYSMDVSASGEIVPSSLKELVYTGPGRVLGLALDSKGGLYLCNTVQVSFHHPVHAHHRLEESQTSFLLLSSTTLVRI